MPSWGRPQGARGSRRRRQWEREQALWEEGVRVEELDSDDDTDTQGVGLNFQEKRFASDPLQFTGIDLTSGPRSRRRYTYDDETESSDETSEESDEEGDAMQIAMRDKEEALVQSALARIRRAQEKGKREVKLNQDELDALERRRKRMQSAATAKTSRKDSGSGSGNEKRRSNRQSVSLPGLLSGEPISRKGKAKRIENAPAGPAAPGMVVSGPDGPTHYPLGYYPPQANGSRGSPSRPHSSTNRELPPPQYRHFSDNTRPTSSSSNGSRRPMPDDDDWIPSNSRRTSVSSHASYSDPFQYQTSSGHPPPIPEQYMQRSGRRNVSGPAEVSYSSVRRSLPAGAYPTSSRATASDPSLTRRRDGEMPDSQSSSEGDQSDDLGNGVQVFVEEKAPEKERAVVPSRKPVASNKKRGKGR